MGSILSMQWPVQDSKRLRPLPDFIHILKGAVHQARGRLSVITGTLLHNDIMRARGHRQQLVGLLQRFWRRDRRSVEAWIDALLKRGAPRATPVARRAWRPSAAAILHQE
jgi:uncharacterized protein YjbJ (UPF0337 family)